MTLLITNQQGNEKKLYDYYPFGAVRIEQGDTNTKKQFTGYERDTNTGLDYAGQRYLKTEIGKFLSQDSVALFNPSKVLSDPQQLNSYSYARNNPVRFVDPDGNLVAEVYLSLKLADFVVRHTENLNHNIREINFIANHPVSAARIGPIDNRYPGGLANTSSNFAINLTNDGYPPNQGEEGTERNTLRYTIWHGIVSAKMGKSIAIQMGNAHEDNPFINTFQTFDTLSQADVAVDILNNQIGRSLVSSGENVSNVEIAERAVNQFYNDGLYTAKQNENGWQAVKTKLTESQYKKSLREVRRLNNKGKRKK